MAERLLKHVQGAAVIGDTGYDSDRMLRAIEARGMKPVIFPHPCRNQIRRVDRRLYVRRYLVEVFFHRLKRFRGVATRYDKTADNYLAMVHFACALLWLGR